MNAVNRLAARPRPTLRLFGVPPSGGSPNRANAELHTEVHGVGGRSANGSVIRCALLRVESEQLSQRATLHLALVGSFEQPAFQAEASAAAK